MCALRRLRSDWAGCSESLLCAQWVAKDPSFLHADSEDWSDWADAQADPSLRWVHMPFCWFCQAAAQFKDGHSHHSRLTSPLHPLQYPGILGNVGWYIWQIYKIDYSNISTLLANMVLSHSNYSNMYQNVTASDFSKCCFPVSLVLSRQ